MTRTDLCKIYTLGFYLVLRTDTIMLQYIKPGGNTRVAYDTEIILWYALFPYLAADEEMKPWRK